MTIQGMKNSERYGSRWYHPVDQDNGPIAVFLTFSSFSPRKADIWSRGISHKYEIVLLPGYSRPSKLNRRDVDAIWYEAPVTSPTPVWDNSTPHPLFEVISECFDPFGEMTDFIKVREVASGKFVEDPRPKGLLKKRPVHSFDEDLLSLEREDRRRAHFRALQKFYSSEASYPGFDHSMFFSDLWIPYPDDEDRVKKHRFYVDRMSPAACDAGFRAQDQAKGKDRLKDPNLRFGLSVYESALRKKPSYYRDELELERRIANGDRSSPVEVAFFKVERGIPVTEEERQLYEGSEGDKLRAKRNRHWTETFEVEGSEAHRKKTKGFGLRKILGLKK